jgi:hypothetical protein
MDNENGWRIIVAEQNMDLGRVDNLFFGIDTCHSFVALQAPDEQIVSEIHGTTFLPSKSRLRSGGQSLQSYFRAWAQMVNLPSAFERAVKGTGMDKYFPRLKVVVTPGAWRMDVAESTQVVMEGPKNSILTEWIDACRIGDIVNAQDFFYVPVCPRTSGQNCNSVTSLMLHAMDIEMPKSAFRLKAVGYNNKLHQKVDALRAFNTREQYDPRSLEGMLQQYTRNPDGFYFRYDPDVMKGMSLE